MKLKTLKELSHKIGLVYSTDTFFTERELRKEAIEWIKEIRAGETWTDYVSDDCPNHENLINWIKHFFNLTEEDLK